MNKDQIIEKLRRVDENLFFEFEVAPARKPYVIVIGGSAIMLRGLSDKMASKDIDVLHYETMIEKQLFADPDINAQSGAYCLNIPYGFEGRLVEVELGFRLLKVFTPSAEDLAVMKLYRWEEPDRIDLCSKAFLAMIDWGVLEKLVYDPNEAQASRIAQPENDREYKAMVANFEEYKSRCCDGEKL